MLLEVQRVNIAHLQQISFPQCYLRFNLLNRLDNLLFTAIDNQLIKLFLRDIFIGLREFPQL